MQLEVFVSSLKCFLVNTLAVLLIKFEAVPMCGVLAAFAWLDTLARAEVDISAVMIGVPADSVS